MGNCQAAEAATVVIQHPGKKIERVYWAVSAHVIMNSNPGHYVALVLPSQTSSSSSSCKSENVTHLNQLKLLRPHDTLLLGQVYRLISFEDVLKEFASKKSGKLGKLLKENGGNGIQMKHKDSTDLTQSSSSSSNSDGNSTKVEWGNHGVGSNGSSINNKSGGRHFSGGGGGQWRPALQSIAEFGN